MRRVALAMALALALALVLACAASAAAVELGGQQVPRERFVVFLMIGHSNMEGRTSNPGFGPHPRIWEPAGRRWRPAEPHGRKDHQCGPEMFLLTELAERFPDLHFGYVKAASSGGTVKEDFAKGRSLYQRIVGEGNRIKQEATLGGIIAMLGFVEAEHGDDPKRADHDFLGSLEAMVQAMRADLDRPELPFLIGQYEYGAPHNQTSRVPKEWQAKIAQAIEGVEQRIPHAAIIRSDGPYRDGHHFDATGMRRWSEAAVQILAERGWVGGGGLLVSLGVGAPHVPAGGSVRLTATASGSEAVARVQWLAGDQVVAEDADAPYEASWSGPAAGLHVVRARAIGAGGTEATSRPVVIGVGDVPRILFVAGEAGLTQPERLARDRFTELGFLSDVRDDDEVAGMDAEGFDLVFLAPSVPAISVRKFIDVPVPVLVSNEALAELALAEPDATGRLERRHHLLAVDPVAGGPPQRVEVVTDDHVDPWWPWAATVSNMHVVAADEGDPSRAVVFGFDAGAALPRGGRPAPARRVATIVSGAGMFSDAGWTIFDAAVRWAAGR